MKEYIGWNTLQELGKIFVEQGSKRILLVTGKTSYKQSGAEAIVAPLFSGYDVTYFTLSEKLPTLETISKGVRIAQEKNIDTILAIGGGNALDTAKSIALLAMQSTTDYQGIIAKKVPITKPALAHILVPTTAGTGSEATHFAVVYISKEKYSLAHPSVLPEYAIVDPALTVSLPAYETAHTGMDALAQAIEAFWSVNSTEESKKYSREAIRLILPAIKDAVTRGYKDTREAMMYGAHLAGKAINIAKTTAPHAVSYPITSYFSIPHGHAVGLTLPSFIAYNALVEDNDLQDKRGIHYVQNMFCELLEMLGCKNAAEAKIMMDSIMEKISLPTTLTACAIQEKDIPLILDHGFNPERIINNPRKISRKQLQTILQERL